MKTDSVRSDSEHPDDLGRNADQQSQKVGVALLGNFPAILRAIMTFQEILDELRIPHRTAGNGARHGWIDLPCPRCGHHRDGSGKFYLGYNIAQNRATCWTCGAQRLSSIILALSGKTYADLRELLQGLDRGAPEVGIKKSGRFELPPGVGPLKRIHRRYLRERLPRWRTDDLVDLWDLGGISQAYGEFSWRVYIPIKYRGEAVSWTARGVSDAIQPKYLSASAGQESIPHKTLLYGEDHARETIIVHEGPLDAWAVGPGATATCGTGFSPAQIWRISRYGRRFICFDAEPAGQRRARELCDALEAFPGETSNVLLDSAKDSADASPREIRQLRKLLR